MRFETSSPRKVWPRWRSTLTAVALAGCQATAASAQSSWDTPIVGGAGTSFALTCPNGTVLVGVYGRFSTRLDRLQGICRMIDVYGNWVGTSSTFVFNTSPPAAGGPNTGGQTFHKTCLPNQAVAGFDIGKPGSSVTRLALGCRQLGPGGVFPSQSTGWYVLIGISTWTGPTPGHHYLCANQWPALALIGRETTSSVTAIGLRCGQPTIPFGWFAPIYSGRNTSEPVTARLGSAEDAIDGHNIWQIVTQAEVKVRPDNQPCQSCHTGAGTPGSFSAATIDRAGFCARVPAFQNANKPDVLKRLFKNWADRTCPN